MGRHYTEEEELQGYLNSIIERIEDETALGITKLFIKKGMKALSDKQKYVFKTKVLDAFLIKECHNCGIPISDYEEMEYILDNGICSSCQYDWDKNYQD